MRGNALSASLGDISKGQKNKNKIIMKHEYRNVLPERDRP